MIQLAIVGGTSIYHGYAFSGLINGVAAGQTLPAGWPAFPQVIEDARISVVWDEDREAAEKLARVFGIEHVAATLEDVLPYCDAVIVTDDGTRNHCRHAPFFLERGLPTFIDKPLAPDVETAEKLVELAARHNAPLMSSSSLRYAAETAELRAQPDKLGRIELSVATGPNELFYYGIHPLELAHSILGGGIASVQNIGSPEQDIVKVSYEDGRILMLLVSRVAGCRFELTLYGSAGQQHFGTFDPTKYYATQLQQLIQMARDRKAPAPIGDALEILRVLEKGKLSLQQGGKELPLT